MEICDNGHETICYDSEECPFCKLQLQYNDLEDNLKQVIEELRTKIKELSKEV